MSDAKEEFNKKLAAQAEIDRRKKELSDKKLILDERRVENDLETLQGNDRDMKIAKMANFGQMSEEQIAHTRKENAEYMEAAKKKMLFINNSFNNVIPFFRKNLILIGGKTGEGKSTTVANVVSSAMRQTNKDTGKRCRVLVITNEEKSEDVYNRVTCLAKGWHYTNHDKFTEEQKKTFDEFIPILAKGGWLTVVDDSYGSTADVRISGVTTSLEGIATIFDNLIRDQIYYDVVLIDYYQNIKFSKNNPRANEWEVQAKLSALLDQYKNTYPAPIVLMAQVTPPDAEGREPFKTRIEGRKVILNVSTCCVEMVADRALLRTKWLIHKNRFSETVGTEMLTGYDSGRFVEYTPEFIAHVNEIIEKRRALEMDKNTGIKFEEAEETENE